MAVPATAVGGRLIVKFLVLVTFAQGAVPEAVSVNVTLPEVMSAALGE